MFAIFAARARQRALAVAGSALVATTLMATVAAAAPAERQPAPADAESVAVQPVVNLPRADAYIDLYKIELSGLPKYHFSVENHGPERASFKVKVQATWRECSGCDFQEDKVEETVTLASGTGKEYQVECKATMVQRCENGYGEVKVVGLDPNEDNNVAYIVH
jgi:hypothetical protein